MHIWLLAASIVPLLFACQERNATTQAERLKSLTAEMLDLDSGVWYASHMVAFSPSPQVALSLMADTALPFEAELIWTTDAKEIGNDAPASSFGLGAVSADFMYCAYYGEKQVCGDLLRTLGSVADAPNGALRKARPRGWHRCCYALANSSAIEGIQNSTPSCRPRAG